MKITKSAFLILALAIFLTCDASGYNGTGHEIIGAIADKRLANSPSGEKIKNLLDGLSLERAATMADEIKGWDKRGADDPGVFHFLAHPKIDSQLRDFWRANQPTHDKNSPMPSHHWFHYTDVPLLEPEKYSDGKVGRNKWDIVHMISYCVAVLKGETPEDNPRKITKPVAIILLAHYVGDIHQPLHVGAEYFDAQGHTINPDKGGEALEDEGGNTLALHARGQPENPDRPLNLHGFWDNDAVMINFPVLPDTLSKEERFEKINAAKHQLVDQLASQAPKNWELSPSIPLKDYAENWANEILPLAREAHERLRFEKVNPTPQDDGRIVAAGEAAEKDAPDQVAYREWAGKIVRQQLHKAGWRLADLLEKAVQ